MLYSFSEFGDGRVGQKKLKNGFRHNVNNNYYPPPITKRVGNSLR